MHEVISSKLHGSFFAGKLLKLKHQGYQAIMGSTHVSLRAISLVKLHASTVLSVSFRSLSKHC